MTLDVVANLLNGIEEVFQAATGMHRKLRRTPLPSFHPDYVEPEAQAEHMASLQKAA